MERSRVTAEPRKIVYVSGTRADFGLMKKTLATIDRSDGLDLEILVTGMHLDERYGRTISEIEDSGLRILGKVPNVSGEETGAAMAKNLAGVLDKAVSLFAAKPPDFVVVLGDRGEMLAGALAAAHLNIPVVHIHGGERSGTIDESIRHAISKLAHFHFVATADAKDRLVRMGEIARSIYVVGAPGLDGLTDLATKSRAKIFQELGFDPSRKLVLFLYHPVLQEAQKSQNEAEALLSVCLDLDLQVLALMPNSDAGSKRIRQILFARMDGKNMRVETHLPRADYVSTMAACDAIVGNSSSGIIEAATFGTPVLNIGTRQNFRYKGRNVVDVFHAENLRASLSKLLAQGRFPIENVYQGNGTAEKIVDLLLKIEANESTLKKVNSY